MKTKQILIMALAVFSLAACSKDNAGDQSTADAKSVYLKIGAGTLVANDIPNISAATTILDINLFFVNAAGAVLSSHEVNTGSTPSIDELKAGYEFKGVNGAAKTVFVVANNAKNSGPTIGTMASLELIKAATIQASSQNPDAAGLIGSWNSVTMAGEGSIAAGVGNKATVTVAIAPLMSRIEISKVTSDVSIKSFKVKGIYINNHYKTITVGGSASDPISNYALPEEYKAANFDGYSDIAAADGELTADAGTKCYGYQVVPAATVANLPHIVLALSDVVVAGASGGADITLEGIQYVTVKSFKDKANAALAEMKANNVYKIADIKFSSKNVSEVPEAKDIDVTVTVSVTNWNVNDITPEL